MALNVIAVGQTIKRQILQVKEDPDGLVLNAPPNPAETQWNSLNTDYLTVTAHGTIVEITGVAPGRVQILGVTDPNGAPVATTETWIVFAPGSPGALVGAVIVDA